MKPSFLASVRVWMAAILSIGWFAAAYLLYEYVTGGPIACGSAGCDVVRSSDWAYIGPIPMPLFGVAFYTGMLMLLVGRSLTSAHAKLLRTLTFIGASIALLESIGLFLIQWLDVKAFCLWCLVSGAATLGVWTLAWFDRPTEDEALRLRDLTGYAAILVAFAVIASPTFLFLVRPELFLRS